MPNQLRLALYQPDIPQNTGAMMRLCACFGIGLDIIEPCGFPYDDRKLKRTVMDYGGHVEVKRHMSWDVFRSQLKPRRLVLLTTKVEKPYYDVSFRSDDVLMVGRESAGVPTEVHQAVDISVTIP